MAVKKVKVELRTIINSDSPLKLTVSQKNIDSAKCGDPVKCVIGQAIAAHYGPGVVDGWQVGSNITKIYTQRHIIRYSTPSSLANSLRMFDKTGLWHLPPGEYSLRPLAKSYRRGGRWNKKKHSGGTRDMFRAAVSAPTRHAMTICEIKKAA